MSEHEAESQLAQSSSSPTSPSNIAHGTNPITDALSPEQPTSASKRTRGRPRKYHTDAEREEAKRRYRETHKEKVASGTGTKLTPVDSNQSHSTPKQQDVDELWEAINDLRGEVAGLKAELAERDAAAAAAAAPAPKRRKV